MLDWIRRQDISRRDFTLVILNRTFNNRPFSRQVYLFLKGTDGNLGVSATATVWDTIIMREKKKKKKDVYLEYV